MKLPEHVTKRAEVLAEVAATLCTNHPEVRRFRRKYLGGRLLTNEEARAFLDERGGPYGTNRAARKNTKAGKRLLEGTEGPFRTPGEMKELLRLAEKLSTYYPWEEGDALWFVLTGYFLTSQAAGGNDFRSPIRYSWISRPQHGQNNNHRPHLGWGRASRASLPRRPTPSARGRHQFSEKEI